MAKIYKCILILMILSILFVSCSSDEDTNLSDALSDALQNIQIEENEQAAQSHASENTTGQNNYGFENPNNIDYSPFNALVRSYRKSLSSSYGELTDDYMGYFYANLIDLNADDVYELVIARIYDSDTEGNVDEIFNIASENFIGSQEKSIVHVYYLDENGTVGHADEFPLSFYGEEGVQFNIEYAEVDGINYLVLGGDTIDFGITSSDYVFAKAFVPFNGEYFEMAETFIIQYDYANAGYEPTNYMHNMANVSEEEFNAQFDKWSAKLTYHTFVAQGYDTNTDEVTQRTIDFLNNFELKDTHGDAFTYSNGNFVIYERGYFNYEELALKYLLDAITYQDFMSMSPHTADDTVIEDYKTSREDGMYYPGLIVEEMELIYPESYGWENIQIMQTILEDARYEKIAEMYRQNSLENTFILKVDAKEIIDMEVVQYAGQFGLNVTQYYIFEADENGSNHKLLAVFNDNFFWGHSNALEVSYITDYPQIFNAYGYEYPIEIMNMYFTEEEINNMDSYITEDAKEAYFIRNLWGSTMKIYENYIDENMDYARGDLLHETSADVLYLGCSSDHVEDYLIYTDVQIVAEPFPGYEVVYYPSISHPDTWVQLGEYAQQMPQIN